MHAPGLSNDQISHRVGGLSIGARLAGKSFLVGMSRDVLRICLTREDSVRCFCQFFVSLSGSTSCRSYGGTNFCFAKAEEIGAHDARHREHLMAPARQLTSSASLKGKEVVGNRLRDSKAPRRASDASV